ncbi:MAG TPA: DUF4365 domain-containing protein [Cyclobacteriaceae bacterium]|nr:DUF4365 domain-containing protein [Cyclobacteriaceae bacterium]
MAKAPINYVTHRKERESARAFEALVDPCVVNWNVRDYGTDCSVQFAEKLRNDGSATLSGLHFFVQLKSTERETSMFSFQTDVSKLVSWSASNVPVALVIYLSNSKRFYYKLISQEFISLLSKTKPDWSTKKTVGIQFNEKDVLSKENLYTKFKDLLNQLGPKHNPLLPGTYFSLKHKAKKLIDDYRAVTSELSFDSPVLTIDRLIEKLDLSIYKVAVVGPSRSGKSTLINCLLKRDISPMGIFQTTGVPIQIIPGSKDQVEIFFLNGKRTRESFSQSVIKSFAAQDENVGNDKKVKFLTVTVVNELLEKGISFYDVPGLDDPDDEILENTYAFVKTFNAVIFVIDISPAQHGGFLIRSDFKSQLLNLSSTLDKVFLVFNKVDVLTVEKLAETKKHIEGTLKRLNILDKVDSKIHYLSAGSVLNDILKTATATKSLTDLNGLENDIWKFILDGNRTGLFGMISVLKEMSGSIIDLDSLLKVRLINSSAIESLSDEIKKVKNKHPELSDLISRRKREIYQSIKLKLESKKNALVEDLHNTLKLTPKNVALPNKQEIRRKLKEGMIETVNFINNEFIFDVMRVQNDVDSWIENNLKKIREFLNNNSPTRFIDISPLENLVLPDNDLSASFGMGLFVGIMTSFLSAGSALVFGVFAFFAHLIISAESMRAKEIMKIMDSARAKCDEIIAEMLVKYEEALAENLERIEVYAQGKFSAYFSDVRKQIDDFKMNPLSESEVFQYNVVFEELNKIQKSIEAFKEEIYSYK